MFKVDFFDLDELILYLSPIEKNIFQIIDFIQISQKLVINIITLFLMFP